jgi:hypothetical protein
LMYLRASQKTQLGGASDLLRAFSILDISA